MSPFSLHAAERSLDAHLTRRLGAVLAYKIAREETPRFTRTLARALAFSVARRARLIRKGAHR